MNKQDSNGVRNAQDLERKYDFAGMLGLKKNIETNEKGLVKIENELNHILNALLINLKDVLDNQSEISLWFYSGIPTIENEPYSSWTNKEEHIGDIYYDKNTGYVYQFSQQQMWELNPSPDLVEAMAITNASTDTSNDHERKVFFNQPTIPYSNGDWWIKPDGSLFICQLSKKEGDFEENDFINSSKYTTTISEKIGDTIEVLKGTITQISENYAKFTDLATGGSTEISGDNIKSGTIKSNNYVKDKLGMLISLINGTIDTKNFKLDSEGNVNLKNGAKIISDNGLMTNLVYQGTVISQEFISTGDLSKCGFSSGKITNWTTWACEYIPDKIIFDFKLPSNFKIVSAKMTLRHCPMKWTLPNSSSATPGASVSYTGYSRNVKLYKANYSGMYKDMNLNNTAVYSEGNITYTEIKNAFGTNGFNPGSANGMKTIESIELKDQISTSEVNHLCVMSSDKVTSNVGIYNNSGAMAGTLEIIGYMAFQ